MDLSIDEMVIPFKGRWKYKQYNPNKPSKYHIKTFGLCDSITGYCYNILTYFGTETNYDPNLPDDVGQSEKIFEYLLRPLGKGHHVFADRYYTTYNLITYLKSKSTYYTGTLQSNRANFPKEIKASKLKHMETVFFRSSQDILLAMWQDKKAKKPVIVVSTKFDNSIVDVAGKYGKVTRKPEVVHKYNFSMNGCDRLDQLVSYYSNLDRKTIKWWKRIFIWLLEVTQVNAYILYALTRPRDSTKVSVKFFKETLLDQLVSHAALTMPVNKERIRKGRPSQGNAIERFDGNKHLIIYSDIDRNCVVCSTPQKRKRTKFICNGCSHKPYLCAKDCFMIYHTKKDV